MAWATWWEEVRGFVTITMIGLVAEYARRKMPPKQKDEES